MRQFYSEFPEPGPDKLKQISCSSALLQFSVTCLDGALLICCPFALCVVTESIVSAQLWNLSISNRKFASVSLSSGFYSDHPLESEQNDSMGESSNMFVFFLFFSVVLLHLPCSLTLHHILCHILYQE